MTRRSPDLLRCHRLVLPREDGRAYATGTSATRGIQAGQAALEAHLPELKATDFEAAKQKIPALALDRARAALAALRAKSPGDVGAYQSFSKQLAERVAQAAKEGGFLGIGGERVSESEKKMLASLDEALA